MEYDLRTCDTAYKFVLDFMAMTDGEYVSEFFIKCEKNYELFWDRNIERIKYVDISRLKIMAFHIVGSLDECREIKTNGLMDLQKVLSQDTMLKRMLEKSGIEFDLPNKCIVYDGKKESIDYDNYLKKVDLSEDEENLKKVAHRVFYDYCVNGFMYNNDVTSYVTNIHERPEFLMTLSKLSKKAKELECCWKSNAKSYRIDFYATIDQVQRFNFELDELKDPPYNDWNQLNDNMKIKKWLLSHAIEKTEIDYGEAFLYIKNGVIIPSSHIIEINEF